MNGKETPKASFLKFTAHRFKRMLSPEELKEYRVNASNKQYEFWQRDPLAIELYSPQVMFQKLDYIHLNPLAGKWRLAAEPADYNFSSASFYKKGDRKFKLLKRIEEAIY